MVTSCARALPAGEVGGGRLGAGDGGGSEQDEEGSFFMSLEEGGDRIGRKSNARYERVYAFRNGGESPVPHAKRHAERDEQRPPIGETTFVRCRGSFHAANAGRSRVVRRNRSESRARKNAGNYMEGTISPG